MRQRYDQPDFDPTEQLTALEREYARALEEGASVQKFTELQKRVGDLFADLKTGDALRELRPRALRLISQLEQQIRKAEQLQPPRGFRPQSPVDPNAAGSLKDAPSDAGWISPAPPPSSGSRKEGRRWWRVFGIASCWCVVVIWFLGVVPWIFFAYGPGSQSHGTRTHAEDRVQPYDPAAGMDPREELAVRGSVPGPTPGSFEIPKDALDLAGLSIARQLEMWPEFCESLCAAVRAGSYRRDVVDEVLLACAGARKHPNPHAFSRVFAETAAHDLLAEAQARRELRAAIVVARQRDAEDQLAACLAGYVAAKGRPVFERVARWAALEGLTLRGPSEWTRRH